MEILENTIMFGESFNMGNFLFSLQNERVGNHTTKIIVTFVISQFDIV